MQQNERLSLPDVHRPVELGKPLGKNTRRFLACLICCGLLIAAFAVSGVWKNDPSGSFPQLWESFWNRTDEESPSDTQPPQGETPPPSVDLSEQQTQIPEGAIAVVGRDLSGSGAGALCNETVFAPDMGSLRFVPERVDPIAGKPLVLILHTHATEGYLSTGTDYLQGEIGDSIYTTEAGSSVLAVGAHLSELLNQNGISAIHCNELHGSGASLRGAYAAAGTCIKRYLASYPSIRYVIDLHRDSILNAEGEYLKSLVSGAEQPTAQIQAVVGTSGNGTPCPQWENNLAMAQALMEELNAVQAGIGRPIYLKNASYNQELAPVSLLLEIGTGGNTVEEALRATELLGKTLSKLLLGSNR